MSFHTQYSGLLGLSNIILLISSTTIIYLGAGLTNFYLLDKIDFISSYFSIVPYAMIFIGVATFITALFGCYVAVQCRRWLLYLFAMIMTLLFMAQLGGIFAAMELRGIIDKGEYPSISILDDLKDYKHSPSTRDKWDALHREFHCCGGINFNTGYKMWSNADIGREDDAVPDSCCLRQTNGCGRNILKSPYEAVTQRIHTHGCITIMEEMLREQIIPILLGYAGVAVLLALVQLLCVVFACAYASAISRHVQKQEEEQAMCRHTNSSPSPPSTPRFDHIRYNNAGYTNTNLGHVFIAGESSLERKRRLMESPTASQEREV